MEVRLKQVDHSGIFSVVKILCKEAAFSVEWPPTAAGTNMFIFIIFIFL